MLEITRSTQQTVARTPFWSICCEYVSCTTNGKVCSKIATKSNEWNRNFDLPWTFSAAVSRWRVSRSRDSDMRRCPPSPQAEKQLWYVADVCRPTPRWWFKMENMKKVLRFDKWRREHYFTHITTSLLFGIVEKREWGKERIVAFEPRHVGDLSHSFDGM